MSLYRNGFRDSIPDGYTVQKSSSFSSRWNHDADPFWPGLVMGCCCRTSAQTNSWSLCTSQDIGIWWL